MSNAVILMFAAAMTIGFIITVIVLVWARTRDISYKTQEDAFRELIRLSMMEEAVESGDMDEDEFLRELRRYLAEYEREDMLSLLDDEPAQGDNESK